MPSRQLEVFLVGVLVAVGCAAFNALGFSWWSGPLIMAGATLADYFWKTLAT